MSDVLTPAKNLTQPATGSHINDWGAILNTNFGLIDTALGGTLVLAITGNVTLNTTQVQNTGYQITGSLGSTAIVTFPSYYGLAVITNSTNQAVSCGIAGGNFVSVPVGYIGTIWSDGTNFSSVSSLSEVENISSAMAPVVAATTLRTAQAAMNVPGVYNVQNIAYGGGADPTGTADCTAVINAAVAAAATAGGGIIFFPPGTYKITGTIAVTTGGIVFEGCGEFATWLNFANGSADCFTFIGPTYGSPLNYNQIRHLTIAGTSKTGGRMLFLQFCAFFIMEGVECSNVWNGIENLSCASVTVRDVSIVGVVSGSGGWGIYFHAPSDGSANNKGFTLNNVTVNCAYSGADGIKWDGSAQNLNCTNCSILSTHNGVYVLNSAETTNYPQFGTFMGVFVTGASNIGVYITAGASFNFTGCHLRNGSGNAGQGSADANAVCILADTGFSYTREILFSNCSIGVSLLSAVNTAGQNVLFNQCQFIGGGVTTPNTVDAVTVASGAADTLINGCIFSLFGAPNSWRYGINIASGTFRTISNGCNFNIGCTTGPYLNSSTDGNTFIDNYIGPPASQPGYITQIPAHASAPTNPGVGQQYYDTSLVTARYWNGSAWVNYP